MNLLSYTLNFVEMYIFMEFFLMQEKSIGLLILSFLVVKLMSFYGEYFKAGLVYWAVMTIFQQQRLCYYFTNFLSIKYYTKLYTAIRFNVTKYIGPNSILKMISIILQKQSTILFILFFRLSGYIPWQYYKLSYSIITTVDYLLAQLFTFSFNDAIYRKNLLYMHNYLNYKLC